MRSEIVVLLAALALSSCVQAYHPYTLPPQCSREGMRLTISRAQFLLKQLENCLNEDTASGPSTTTESSETATIDDSILSTIFVTSSPETLPPSTGGTVEGSKRNKVKKHKSRLSNKSQHQKKNKHHHGHVNAKKHDKA